jgi:cellulose synthase/poly-beta-1,6-N-acetylglucosamine synthase-like glycosyltransferase
MHTLRLIFDTTFVAYFMALNLAYTALLLLGSRQVSEWVRRRPLRDFRGVSRSELSLPVTILAPAYNEEPVIVPSIRSLLASHYRGLQVMVINDGSTDGTLGSSRRPSSSSRSSACRAPSCRPRRCGRSTRARSTTACS